ncbi:Uncharacterized membrane protein [Thermoanaerobacter thermohydrosulfuricus]|jgi:uncharacterized membrane protein|uniref:DUF1614 domain-containing protein n=4 Tax=Thermoanaerobacter TaxID=1754 RepID=G2MX28_9THEO|nr:MULTISPECIES: DUF1614 domain-containing protein [Thermoanaerobacter]EGD50634.1 protein of unknown function DUF1614 [Thermoanaerobacter ethanolicus JW 200]AEM79654.1 protein of unknown function DUF1614 [Thermoanaerobacter wiegelii Rt8.B1]EIV99820.1 putative membrane protein [Thermoanaerobacter siderophilus SR4]EMT38963.1 putative membrane protein [Thermoanaerobacter thermohydrosulfuricus WC1]MBT1278583.1 DUF1614 domain-containing protein [Thermoanaerobacter sp. CM-CNRG TB177]
MPLIWILSLILLFPFLIFTFFVQATTFSFAKLGLSPQMAVFVFSLSLIGSVINIPISRKKIIVHEEERYFSPFLFYYPPRVQEQVIAVNVGGAVVPVILSLYLLPRAPLLPTIIATIIVTIVAKALAKPVQGVGITLPAFIPPLVAAASAILLSPHNAAPVAYISGVLGTLIGADLLNLPHFKDLTSHAISIGGAGIFDGIFLVGVVAALLA